MNGIVEFLTARLDEDEEVAIVAARGAAYQTGDEAPEWSLRSPLALWSAPHGHAFGNVSPMAIRAATHIARHDPARVLREVEAKRRTLERHSPTLVNDSMACDGCGWDREDGHHVEDIEECPELRDMASVYAEHADYEQSWSVL